jgi:alpha-L-fucosidase
MSIPQLPFRFRHALLRLFLFALLTVFFLGTLCAQNFLRERTSDRNTRMAWWREARFGMFIHWGLYAVPAGEWNGEKGYGEWIRTSAQIPLDTYDRFRPKFLPLRFDARA